MRTHITFDSIDCKNLQYVRSGKVWVCLGVFCELEDVSECMECRFTRLKLEEARKRLERVRG